MSEACGVNRPTQQSVGIVGTLAFGCELFMLALLVYAGISFSSSVVGIVLAVVLPVAAIAIWGVWMAPASRRRLADPARLAAQCALFVVVGVLVAAAGRPVWGVAFAVVASAVFAMSRRLP